MSTRALVIRGAVMGSLFTGGSFTPTTIAEEILSCAGGAPTQAFRPGDVVVLPDADAQRFAALGLVQILSS